MNTASAYRLPGEVPLNIALPPKETYGPCPQCGDRTSVERIEICDASGRRTERWIRCLRIKTKEHRYNGVVVKPCPIIKEVIENKENENVTISTESREKYNSLWAKDKVIQISRLASMPINTVKGYLYGGSSSFETAKVIEKAISKLWAQQNKEEEQAEKSLEAIEARDNQLEETEASLAYEVISKEEAEEPEPIEATAQTDQTGAVTTDNCVHQPMWQIYKISGELAHLPVESWPLVISLAELELQRRSIHSQIVSLFQVAE